MKKPTEEERIKNCALDCFSAALRYANDPNFGIERVSEKISTVLQEIRDARSLEVDAILLGKRGQNRDFARTSTERGFTLIVFRDQYNEPCSLQISSTASIREDDGTCENPSGFLWLGRDGMRMHLGDKEVKFIVERLSEWLSTGEI